MRRRRRRLGLPTPDRACTRRAPALLASESGGLVARLELRASDRPRPERARGQVELAQPLAKRERNGEDPAVCGGCGSSTTRAGGRQQHAELRGAPTATRSVCERVGALGREPVSVLTGNVGRPRTQTHLLFRSCATPQLPLPLRQGPHDLDVAASLLPGVDDLRQELKRCDETARSPTRGAAGARRVLARFRLARHSVQV
jgi:hypothetical protein